MSGTSSKSGVQRSSAHAYDRAHEQHTPVLPSLSPSHCLCACHCNRSNHGQTASLCPLLHGTPEVQYDRGCPGRHTKSRGDTSHCRATASPPPLSVSLCARRPRPVKECSNSEAWLCNREKERDCPYRSQEVGPGGATTTGPDATPPPSYLSKLAGGGGQLERGGGGIGSLAREGGGGVHATHYYHMHTSRGCLGAWGYRGMYAIIAISCLCQEASLKGLKDQRHSTPLH